MSFINQYNSPIAIHPGEHIKEIIEDMDVTQSEFANRLGVTNKYLSDLINGKAGITEDKAERLARMFGNSMLYWLNLQSNYDVAISSIATQELLETECNLLVQVDFELLVKLGLVKNEKSKTEKVKQLRSLYRVASLQNLNTIYSAAFRKSLNTKKNNSFGISAWLQTCEILTKNKKTCNYNKNNLSTSINAICKMTILEPYVFMPQLNKLLLECGIILILLPHFSGTGISGATKWLSCDTAMVSMSSRGKDADKFWFTLLHELYHVLQEHKKEVTISFEDNTSDEDETEQLANEFAANSLIPYNELQKFLKNAPLTKNEILSFAEQIGIMPGIVVGRLQHDGLISYNTFNYLKQKYTIDT